MMYQRIERAGFYYGFPVILMTTRDKERGTDNVTPLSSSWTLSDTIVIGIGRNNKGFQNLAEGADATFSVPDAGLYEKVKRIEKMTGAEEVTEIKKDLGYTYAADSLPSPGSPSCRGKLSPPCGLPSAPST